MKTEKHSILIGLFLALIVFGVTFQYYRYKEQNEIDRQASPFLEAVESLDLRFNDFKFKVRDERKTDAPVALVAVDGDSLAEIGRWPWSRELMAEMTQKLIDLGATSVGFDIIFSEPERGFPESDQKLAKTIAANKDKVVLGVQSDDLTNFLPHQDYCVAEAFLSTGGEQIIKLNPSFIVDENGSYLDDVKWNTLFEVIFANIKQQKESEVLMSLGKSQFSDLTLYQKNYLNSQKNRAIFEYCQSWLTDKDIFLKEEVKPKIEPLYKKIFSKVKQLKDLNLDQAIAFLKQNVKAHAVPQYGEWLGNIGVLQEESLYTASFVAKQDYDGYIRRYPLFFRSGNKIGSSYIPSLALQTYLSGMGYRADVKVSEVGDKRIVSSFSIVDAKSEPEKKVAELPIDKKGQLIVNFYGKQMSVFYVPAKELFSEFDDMTVQKRVHGSQGSQLMIENIKMKKKDFFKGRMVLVGATATGIYDLRTVPLEPNYPGSEIHMTVLANLLEQNFIYFWSKEATWMPWMVLMVGILVTLSWSFLGAIISLNLFFAINLLFLSLDLVLFTKFKVYVSSMFIITQFAVIFFGITIFKYFTEEKKKKEIKQTFSKYVSPKVVDEILKDVENLKLGGRKQRMTVFFSDLRGFTTISEKLTPTELSNLLNRYLTPMTEIVFQNEGTLDKYMGDAIMAFFGAPIPHAEHPHHACRCALKSMEKLKELQKEFAAENLPHIDIGIGINTGDMSVGNMGSNIVQNYTVMGDAVNLGSRLEGINKEYGTHIIISEFTNEEVKEKFSTREVDRVKVKGKYKPVRIYELMAEGPLPELKAEQVSTYNRGLDKFFKMEFVSALEDFKKAVELDPTDKVSKLYVERCEDYITEPPPADWDGVVTMKTK